MLLSPTLGGGLGSLECSATDPGVPRPKAGLCVEAGWARHALMFFTFSLWLRLTRSLPIGLGCPILGFVGNSSAVG